MQEHDALVTSYLMAHYRVDSVPSFALTIGTYSRELADLYRQYKVSSAAFITACNPHSSRLSVDENRHRQQSLIIELERLDLPWLPGLGEDPAGQWPAEESVLLPGIDKKTACELGRLFGQNAIVWCRDDAIPALLWLDLS